MQINTVWAAYFSATDTTVRSRKSPAACPSSPMSHADLRLHSQACPGKEPKSLRRRGPGGLRHRFAGRVPNSLRSLHVASVQGNGAHVPVVRVTATEPRRRPELRPTLTAGGFHPVAGAASCQHSFP